MHIPKEDFILEYQIKEEDYKKPLLLLEKHPKYNNDYCLYYKFNPFNIISENIDKNSLIKNFNGNFIFVIDTSGSMNTGKIDLAKLAVIKFLKSLPENSKYTIISFGSFVYGFEKEKIVNNENIQNSISKIEDINIDYENTELKKALEDIKSCYLDKSTKNRIFILTDGYVYDEDECYNIIKEIMELNDYYTLFYTMGIGDDCNEYLVKGIADR